MCFKQILVFKLTIMFPPLMWALRSGWGAIKIRFLDVMCCCCWYWPPVREVCPNYYVVEFRPRTLTTMDLLSVACCYSLIQPFRPFFLSLFLNNPFPPLYYLLLIRSRSSLKPSLFSPAPHLLSQLKAPPTWTSPAPAACQPPPLMPMPHAACLSLLPFLYLFSLPFASLGLYPGPCCPMGVSPVVFPSTSLCPCPVLPEFFSESWHRPVLVSVSGGCL